MTTTPKNYRLLIASAIFTLAIVAASARGQEPRFPPQPPTDAEASAVDAPTIDEMARRDAAASAALSLPRDTAAQKLRTVLVLIDLGHLDAAALVLPELLQAELDDAGRAALVGEFGSARFLELMRLDPVPAPGAPASPLAGAREFAERCLDAAAAAGHDPQRLARLIAQLQAPTEEERYAARVDLRAAGDPAIAACFAALATAETPQARTNLLLALADLHPAVDDALLAVLDGARGQLRRDAAELAGYLKLGDSLPWLAVLASTSPDVDVSTTAQAALARLGVATPTPEGAQVLVQRRLEALESLPPASTYDSAALWWTWNAEKQRLESAQFTAAQLRTLAAARLARLLVEAGCVVDPASPRRAVIRGLEEAALLRREPSAELKLAIAAMSPATLSVALGEAVRDALFPAAELLAAELGRRKDISVLATPDGLPSPLAAALFSPVRSLRFAALSAVMELMPPHRFPGSSGVTDALWYFAAGAGDPVAIVASPSFTRASEWAGQLRGLGYDAVPTGVGRDALAAALTPAAAPRMAVAIVDSDIGGPLLRETLFQFRSSDRTAHVPVLIAASAPRLKYAQRVAEDFPFTVAAPRPRSDAAMKELVDRALALGHQPLPDNAVRTSQAAAALGWLAKALRDHAPYDEMHRDAELVSRTLFVPELTAPSIDVLAALGTAESQSLLADFASSSTTSIDSRRRAAEALSASLEQFGTQLTLSQLQMQYDRYNASERADADTQQVLGSILDALEKKK